MTSRSLEADVSSTVRLRVLRSSKRKASFKIVSWNLGTDLDEDVILTLKDSAESIRADDTREETGAICRHRAQASKPPSSPSHAKHRCFCGLLTNKSRGRITCGKALASLRSSEQLDRRYCPRRGW